MLINAGCELRPLPNRSNKFDFSRYQESRVCWMWWKMAVMTVAPQTHFTKPLRSRVRSSTSPWRAFSIWLAGKTPVGYCCYSDTCNHGNDCGYGDACSYGDDCGYDCFTDFVIFQHYLVYLMRMFINSQHVHHNNHEKYHHRPSSHYIIIGNLLPCLL